MKFIVATSLILTAGPAVAQSAVTDHAVTGPANKEIRAGWFGSSLNADCTGRAVPEARITERAQNGIVKLRQGKVRTNSAAKCPNAELPAILVFYQSKEGYRGTDTFTLEVKGVSGNPSLHKFNVSVEGMVQ